MVAAFGQGLVRQPAHPNAARLLLTWLMTRRAGELNAVFYQYFMPNVLLTAVGVFGVFRSTDSRPASALIVGRMW